MGCQPKTAAKALAILAAAALLFVVLFPYTPTPTALSISKILFAVLALSTSLLVSRTLVLPEKVCHSRASSSSPFRSYAILNLICVRRR